MSNFINVLLKKYGIIINKYPTRDLDRRIKLFNACGIKNILDVGASTGGYGLLMRNIGYKGKLISFEPIKKSFVELEKKSAKDSNWEVFNYALGDNDKTTLINISENYDSSSFLSMKNIHRDIESRSKYISSEEVVVRKLDSIFNSFNLGDDSVLLKLDAQGFEKQILQGAQQTINKINCIQIELSFQPLYDGSSNYLEMINFLDDAGFEICGIEPGFQDNKTGKLYQFDGFFISKKLSDLFK